MNILYVTNLGKNKVSGVNVVVPQTVWSEAPEKIYLCFGYQQKPYKEPFT